MPKKAPQETKKSDITINRLLKSSKSSKHNQQNPSGKSNRNLPSAEVRKDELIQPELSAENYISEEEALGPTVLNEGYLVLARRYRYCRWGIIALLFLFLLLMFNFFKEDITLENFRYLMRNVNFELKTEIDEEGVILYDSDEENVFALYKSSLVVANRHKLTIYDAGGRSSCTAEHDYTAPALRTSDKYVLAFDRSGGSYALYSTFSQMHTAETSYPISDADVTDDGIYAIASRSKEYFGVVTIYNSAFKMLNKIQKNKYIAAIDLSDDGKSILIASYYGSEGGYTTELMTLRVDSDEPDLLFTVKDTLPYRVQWTAEGEFMLCGSSGLKFFDKNGKVYNEYNFSEQNVIKYSVDAEGSAIVTASASDSNLSTLIMLDAKGKEKGRYTVNGAIISLDCSGDTATLVSESAAWKLEEGKLYRFDADRRLQSALLSDEMNFLCGYTQVLTPEWKKVG